MTTKTLFSFGTEKILIDFGEGSSLEETKMDKVKQALQKVKTDGLFPTLDALKSKLVLLILLGYCNVGVVAGGDVDRYPIDTCVASNGNRAEFVSVLGNLCTRVLDGVTDEAASFTVVGAIRKQGVRFLKPTQGESVVVIELSLNGLLTVQMLRANACRVVGVDPDTEKCALAAFYGAEVCALSKREDSVAVAEEFFSRSLIRTTFPSAD